MGKKAQIWSLDFMLSMMIFLVALASVILAWNHISANTARNQEIRELQLKVLTISDSLIRTPGIPAEWNKSTVEVIGLAADENILLSDKVDRFINLSKDKYDHTKGLLDIGPYDFYFEVRDLNGTIRKNTTLAISNESAVVVPVERYVLYNDRIAKLKLVIWG